MHAHERIRIASSIFEVLPTGEVIGVRGRARALYFDGSGYSCFGHLFEDGVRRISVHRLVAYKKFGEALFAPGIVTRHLDGNPRNNHPDNIAIGTHSDNMMDIPKAVRQQKAVAAASRLRKFSEDTVAEIRRKKAAGASLKQLSAEYGAQKSTLSYIVRGMTYPVPAE
jgi:hypothetical protein